MSYHLHGCVCVHSVAIRRSLVQLVLVTQLAWSDIRHILLAHIEMCFLESVFRAQLISHGHFLISNHHLHLAHLGALCNIVLPGSSEERSLVCPLVQGPHLPAPT